MGIRSLKDIQFKYEHDADDADDDGDRNDEDHDLIVDERSRS